MHMHMLSAVHMVSANTWSEVLTHGPGSNKVYIGSLHAHAQCSAHGQCFFQCLQPWLGAFSIFLPFFSIFMAFSVFFIFLNF